MHAGSVALLDTGLERNGRQPLPGQAALEERHAGTEVGQSVHPGRDLFTAQDLGQGARKVVAVLVHQVVAVAAVLVAQLLDNLAHVYLVEVRVAHQYALLVLELISEVTRKFRRDFEDSRKWERVATVCILCSVNFYTCVEYSEANRSCVFVDPVHVIDIENNRFPSHAVPLEHQTWQENNTAASCLARDSLPWCLPSTVPCLNAGLYAISRIVATRDQF